MEGIEITSPDGILAMEPFTLLIIHRHKIANLFYLLKNEKASDTISCYEPAFHNVVIELSSTVDKLSHSCIQACIVIVSCLFKYQIMI